MNDSYFSDVVLDWTLKHPEMKEYFELVYEYQATYQAFHIRMEYIPYHHGVCELLGEDIMDKLVCPHDYIFAVLDRMYKKLKEDEEKERKKMEIEFARREDNDVRLKMAKAAVVKWYNEHNQSRPISIEDVYIVWFCKVLQNWKALAGTHHEDGMYYEITFDGNNKLVYFDAYKKWQNVQMSGRELKDGVC